MRANRRKDDWPSEAQTLKVSKASVPIRTTFIVDHHPKGRWTGSQSPAHRAHGMGIGQGEFTAQQDAANHQFHLELGKRHANATPDAPAKRQILIGRITPFQKPFGPEFVRIRVDVFSLMGQVNAADHSGTRCKGGTHQLKSRSGDAGKREYTDGVDP